MAANDRDLWFLENGDLRRLPHDATDATTVIADAAPPRPRPEGKLGLSDSLVLDRSHVYWTSDATWPKKAIHRLPLP